MTTPCHAVDCQRPADFQIGSRTLVCAHHYKREVEFHANPERKAEIQAQVAELQGGERK